MTTQSQGKLVFMAIIVILVAALSYMVLNAPDRRTTGEKIGDAVNELPHGVDKAVRQLQDRTPGDKLRDAAKDAGNDIKKSTNQ